MKRKKRIRKLLKAHKQAQDQGDWIPEVNREFVKQLRLLRSEERGRKSKKN